MILYISLALNAILLTTVSIYLYAFRDLRRFYRTHEAEVAMAEELGNI